jgi:hypothetical protein
MHKLTYILLALLMVGCSSSRNNNAPEPTEESDLKGDWTVTSVNFDGFRDYEVTLFGRVSNECIENSRWNFVSNNNRGSYDITEPGCNRGTNNFIWTLDESGKFILKPTNEKYKSDTGNGFALTLKNYTGTSMTLTQTLTVDGGPVVMDIVFIKSQMD